MFSWQGRCNLSASNIKNALLLLFFSFYFLLLSVYFEAVILMASKSTHAQEKDYMNLGGQVRLALFFF